MEDGTVVEAPRQEPPSIEDEPEFALFLEFLAKDALAQPEHLGNVVDLTAHADELLLTP